ncbi:fungal-specific transcription factor domain-containing protein [Mycena leptocephala]|nr:fungal-specific transcription factor domain-containing protein [Mycena leptocephala]
MSSNEEDYGQESYGTKKRRVQRACDVCRRRKSRCDGSQMPGHKCTICVEANLDCTYLKAPPKRPPVASQSYVDSLEAQLEQSEALVRQLRIELANEHFANSSASFFTHSLTSPTDTADVNKEATMATGPDTQRLDGSTAVLQIIRLGLSNLAAPQPPPHPDDLIHVEITRKLDNLSMGVMKERGFIGKSSEAILIKAAIDLKADHWVIATLPSSPLDDQVGADGGGATWRSRRLEYWRWKPWEITERHTHVQTYDFPSEPLMGQLLELYFTHQNMYLPLLHRPTFERGVAEGLHLRDDGFAATVLVVCAIGSRWSMDPRVTSAGLSCGWEWFNQVPQVDNHLFGQTTLYDLQYYCLAIEFLAGSSSPQACWTLVGIGLRLAQAVGIHRRTAHIEVPSVERELLKRAFWVLVWLDRDISSGLGHPCALQYDDFDIELPLECDDEFWEHPIHPFQQPASVPSRIKFFNTMIRLQHILSFSLKTLYGLRKFRDLFTTDQNAFEEKIVAEFDSALNIWRDQIPEHLRWDPTHADPVFFDQSVALHCGYYHLQILIHRQFIPMVRKSASTALASLAICTSAARACANMVDVQRQRKGDVLIVFNLPAVFMSGIVLLLNVWSGKRTGMVLNPSREMANVFKCMHVVQWWFSHFVISFSALQLAKCGIVVVCLSYVSLAMTLRNRRDILAELAAVGQLPLSTPASSQLLTRYDGTLSSAKDASHMSPSLYQTVNRHPSSFTGGAGSDSGTSPMEPSPFAPTPASETWFPPDASYAEMSTDPAQASRELGEMLNLIDSDTISMWANAPVGVQVDDWGTYFTNFSEITQQTNTGAEYHGPSA